MRVYVVDSLHKTAMNRYNNKMVKKEKKKRGWNLLWKGFESPTLREEKEGFFLPCWPGPEPGPRVISLSRPLLFCNRAPNNFFLARALGERAGAGLARGPA